MSRLKDVAISWKRSIPDYSTPSKRNNYERLFISHCQKLSKIFKRVLKITEKRRVNFVSEVTSNHANTLVCYWSALARQFNLSV